MLDYSSLGNAINQLKIALDYSAKYRESADENFYPLFRTATIQAFEYTYELAVKMIKRYLEDVGDTPNQVNEMSFNEVIREAYVRGIINSEFEVWREFRKQRGTTSHAYDTYKAQDVFAAIPIFLNEAEFLYAELQSRNL
jgi:nucleotidyltransferase substrate binding protein (TIGR01987 family)